MTEILDNRPVTKEIAQTCNKKSIIPFKDKAIETIKKSNTNFYGKRHKIYRFDVAKGTSLKGLNLRFSRDTERKDFILAFWFNKVNRYYSLGHFPNIRCKDVEKICLELTETHQNERGLM